VEDFAAVLILAAVSGFVTEGSITASQITQLLLKMALFVASAIVVGLALVPRLVDYVGRQRSSELLVLTVIGLCFSMAVFARWIGISEAIGAFVMGVIVSESKFHGDVVRRIEPIKDLFGAIFFITVGMLVDLALFLEPEFLIGALVITAVFVLAKFFSCTLSTFMFGFGARNSLGAGLSMVSIGEFSLMIAAVAIGSSAIDPDLSLYETIVLVTTLSALIVPYSVKYSDKITRTVEKKTPRSFLVMTSYLNLLVRNIRRRSKTSLRLSNEMRDSITRLFIYIIVMVSTLMVAANSAPLLPEISQQSGIGEDPLLFVLVTGALVIVAAAMYGVWSRSIRLIEISTSEAMLSTKSAENIGYQDTAKALKWVFLAFYVVVGFIVVSPLIQSIIQQGLVFALLACVAIAVAGYALWRSVRTIDSKLEETFERRTFAPLDSSSDLAEIEEIIASLERAGR
jgi:CPA2 family monovalent cation:H+ antiporter-2